MHKSRAGGMERLSSALPRFTPTQPQPESRPQGDDTVRDANFCRRVKVTISLVVENDQQIHAKC